MGRLAGGWSFDAAQPQSRQTGSWNTTGINSPAILPIRRRKRGPRAHHAATRLADKVVVLGGSRLAAMEGCAGPKLHPTQFSTW